MGVRRFTVCPAVVVCFHYPAGIVDVIAVETRSMIDVFPNHAEMPERRAMAFASARNARGGGAIFSTVKIGLLFTEIDDDRRAPGVAFGNMRRDEVSDGVVGAASTEGRSKKSDGSK